MTCGLGELYISSVCEEGDEIETGSVLITFEWDFIILCSLFWSMFGKCNKEN